MSGRPAPQSADGGPPARPAPGAPGVDPTWSSSDKDLVTSSLGPARVWATVGHGVLNEVYWPSTGTPQLRDLTFYLVGDPGQGGPQGWVDLKRARQYTLDTPAPALPLLTVRHSGELGGVPYLLELELLPDPLRDTLLIRYDLSGPYRLAVMAAPHLGGTGRGNRAWTERGQTLLAQRGNDALCLAADARMRRVSAGVVGVSDGWQDLDRHGRLTWDYTEAGPGNVALSAELTQPRGVLALAFAESPTGAHTLARSSLAAGMDVLRERFVQDWQTWAADLSVTSDQPEFERLAHISAAVLRMHEDRTYPGGMVASLSVPWGNSTDSLGGYHLVWPRDAVLSAFAQVACGELDDARRVLGRLIATQEWDGHWAQNEYPSGEPYWNGLQLDQTALPVLLAAKLQELGQPEPCGLQASLRRALAFIARTGPTSEQDRWEENPGVNPFTVAVSTAALIAGAQWLDGDERDYALALAADWNERLEHWCYVEGTPLAAKHGVDGYYIRLAPPQEEGVRQGEVLLRNRWGQTIEAAALVSLDFSYLVRLGLRDVHDPRVLNTLKVVDRVLRRETPSGEWLYYRYNSDGYGEHEDGAPFDENGVGRLWPLLTGERGQLAQLAGEDVTPFLRTMLNCASPGGLLPEQVWDSEAVPERGLYPGRATGSAMPLSWSHAEFLKLLVASQTGEPPERLRAVTEYLDTQPTAQEWHWRNETPVTELDPGHSLRIEADRPFTLRYGWDDQPGQQEVAAQSGVFGIWSVTFSVGELSGKQALNFARRFGEDWEDRQHSVTLHTPEKKAVTRV